MKDVAKSIAYVNKSLELSKELNRDDYLLKCKTFIVLADTKRTIKDREKELLALSKIALTDEQKGLLNKTLFFVTKKEKYKTEAKKIYKNLYNQFKYFDYKKILDELFL